MLLAVSRLTRRLGPSLLLLGAVALLPGCSVFSAPDKVRGNKVEAYQLDELVPGTSSQADVTALIGSPTAKATFDSNTWLYITESTYTRIARTPGVDAQNVLVLTFDNGGVLRKIDKVGKDASMPVTVVARTTPSPGTEASFLQQLFGNIGRFNPTGVGGPGIGGGVPTAGGY